MTLNLRFLYAFQPGSDERVQTRLKPEIRFVQVLTYAYNSILESGRTSREDDIVDDSLLAVV